VFDRPPELGDVEFTTFGCGFGECVVVHVGGGQWIIVDSLIDPNNGRPVALSYLDHLGVNPEVAIKQVVASHWHDDHVRGISEVFRAARTSEFVVSSVFLTEEFLTYMYAMAGAMGGDSELARAWGVMQERRPRHKLRPGQARGAKVRLDKAVPKLASADRFIYRSWALGEKPEARVWALSPSDAAVLYGKRQFAGVLPEAGLRKKLKPIRLSSNKVAVVLWVEVGEVRLLLGSDLEIDSDPQLGWGAILESPYAVFQGKPAHGYKVAHHGSHNGDCDGIWQKMVDVNAACSLTPFVHGSVSLPLDSDLDRLRSRERTAWLTKSPVRSTDWAVDALSMHAGAAVESVRVNTTLEYVSYRFKQDGTREVRCSRGAVEITGG
jgi:Metallo-beta-lactamase superfamily